MNKLEWMRSPDPHEYRYQWEATSPDGTIIFNVRSMPENRRRWYMQGIRDGRSVAWSAHESARAARAAAEARIEKEMAK